MRSFGTSIEIFVAKGMHYYPLAINLCFPPTFMFIVGSLIAKPTESNTAKIEERSRKLFYKDDKPIIYQIKDPAEKSGSVFAFLYFLTFAGSFALVIYILRLLSFNIVSGIVFFVFFSAVTFFGYRVSQGAKELIIVEQKTKIREVILDFITFPFIKLGQWLSDKYAKINFLMFLLDYMIEIPLKSALSLFEEWSGFINKQKENILDR